jgi:aspartate/methionine/tyrosine aminotransferase
MSKILLAQPILKPGYIDLSVGEPHLIRDILLNEIDINKCIPKMEWNDFIYPSPCGYDKLVEFLEEKHQSRVIITNGAKQALGAAFYALNKMGFDTIGMRSPYWALIPPLAELHNLNVYIGDKIERANLYIAPNNPDGYVGDIESYEKLCKKYNAIIIHDAAYYTNIYMDKSIEKKLIGDVQVFSISKMFGLSSLRLGYAVCPNEEMYNHMQYYMEHMTVGVSKMPQMLLLNIFNNIDLDSFESKCYNSLQENKKIARTINKSILEIDESDYPGMFLWAKIKDLSAFDKAKLHIIDGEVFGNKDYIRINLAFSKDKMQDIVDRLNQS